MSTGKVSTGTPTRLRSFDPNRLADLEYRVWVGYYLRKWPQVLRASIGLVRLGSAWTGSRTLHGAWLVLRANQLWAPYPDNHPKRGPRLHAPVLRPGAADLRRAVQPGQGGRTRGRLVAGGTGRSSTSRAARRTSWSNRSSGSTATSTGSPRRRSGPPAVHRAKAMDLSDQWVADGCQPDSHLLPLEHAALVRTYAALLAAVHH